MGGSTSIIAPNNLQNNENVLIKVSKVLATLKKVKIRLGQDQRVPPKQSGEEVGGAGGRAGSEGGLGPTPVDVRLSYVVRVWYCTIFFIFFYIFFLCTFLI